MIRVEEERDYIRTERVVKMAFENAPYSNQTEHELVGRLRKSDAFIPELSLVYEEKGEIVGHILLTKVTISNKGCKALALAPLSVLPRCQKKGIGTQLIQKAFERAKDLGYEAIVVLGDPHYYKRFGFEKASTWNIRAPFDVPDEFFMIKELDEGSLNYRQGTVIYDSKFFN